MARTKFQDYAEYYALKLIMAFIMLFPMKMALKAAEALAIFIYYFIPFRKTYVLSALKLSFPEKSETEIKSILKGLYKHFAKTIVAIMFFPKMSDDKIRNMMKIDEDLLNKTLKKKKGAANQSNHFVDEIMNDMRVKNGVKIILRDDRHASARKVMKALRNNEFVAILVDQDDSKHGIFVPFFGRLCSMPRGAALFALRADCPIFTGFGVHHKDGSMEVKLREIPHPHSGDIDKDVEIINTTYCRHLEEAVRSHPEQWLWFHKKWKTRPPEELKK